MKNSSNNKGKSGGYRIIHYVVTEKNEIYLIAIYSKSEIEKLTDKQIKELIKEARPYIYGEQG